MSNNSTTKKQLSLRVLLWIIVIIIMVVITIALTVWIRAAMNDILLSAEERYISDQASLTNGLFSDTIIDLNLSADDFSIWSGIVDAVNEATEATDRMSYFSNFIDENWTSISVFETYQANFILVRNFDGELLFCQSYNFLDSTTTIEIPDALSNEASITLHEKSKTVYNVDETDEFGVPLHNVTKILFFDGTAYLLVTSPIMNDASANEMFGTATMGIILDSSFFQSITHYEDATFNLIQKSSIADTYSSSTDRSASTASTEITLELPLSGDEQFFLIMTTERIIYAEGYRTVVLTITLAVVFILVLFAIFSLVINKILVWPVERISADMIKIGEQREFDSPPIDPNKYGITTELFTLGNSINSMIEGFKQSQVSLTMFTNMLNGMDSSICVSDIETDEILFINDRIKRDYCITDSAIGKPRAQLFPQRNIYKSLTPVAVSKRDDYLTTWEEYDSGTNLYYRTSGRVINWSQGKRAYMQYSTNITDIKNAEELLKRRLKQQEVITQVTESFLAKYDITVHINRSLNIMGEFFEVDKIIISYADMENNELLSKYGWSKPTSSTGNINFNHISELDQNSFIYNCFINKKMPYYTYHAKNKAASLSNIEKHNIPIPISSPEEVCDIVIIPLHISMSLWGIVTFLDTKPRHDFNDEQCESALLFANLLSGAIMRANAEEALSRMLSIVNASPQFIAYLNESGEFEYFNKGALEISGYSEDEMNHGGIALLIGESEKSLWLEQIYSELESTISTTSEFKIKTKSGCDLILMASVFSTEFYNNGFGMICIDITEIRRLEQELIVAKIHADESSQAKGSFLARMSHEMRTPMNAIIGMTNIAKGADGDIVKKDYCLHKIGDASTHLLGVINDILDMAKIEANKFELSYSSFEFKQMLLRVADVMQFRVDEKKQTFNIAIDDDIPVLLIGDEQHLSQVITNLLANAVKFTPVDGTVTLSASRIDDKSSNDTCSLCIAVKDTGIGITAENQKRLFKSFEQADGGIARKFGGTGLGLAISKHIIELMGGEINVQSEFGSGSEFTFVIQLNIDNSVRSEDISPTTEIDDITDVFKGHTLLLAEDIEINREIVVDLLSDTGITIDCAENGIIAYDMFEANPEKYEMIFMDIHMPEQDGYEATRRIRAIDNNFAKKVPIVAMTANVFREDIEKCLSAGMNDHIGKPIDFAEVLEKLFKYIT
ncbi:MAG: response regulator [Christensenellaceae bacterium]|jgi:PAS domain S-box-containing protein|nr:response regulator [Christensenellaceae bacterium]